MPSPTTEQFNQHVEALIFACDDWSQRDEPVREWFGAMVKVISDGIDQAAIQLIDFLESENSTLIEESSWHTVLAADYFAEKWQAWKKSIAMRPQTTHPGGDDSLWIAYRQMCEAREPRFFSTLEGMLDLERQGVSMRQRAIMYGYYLDNGEPDLMAANIETERQRKKGYEPAETMTPDDRIREETHKADWAKRSVRVTEVIESRIDKPSKQPTESVHDLVILPHITKRQIKLMLSDVTDDQIAEACAIHGVRLNEQQFAVPEPRPETHEEAQNALEAEQRAVAGEADRLTHADDVSHIEDVETRIMALHEQQGLKAGEISKLLLKDGTQIGPSRVGKVISEIKKRRKEESLAGHTG